MSVEPQSWNDGQIPQVPRHAPSPASPIDYSKLDQETLFKMFPPQITEEEIERRMQEPTFTYEEVKAEIERRLSEQYPGAKWSTQ